jgi:D-sedoheptulose 7-phosphate isomerase
MSPGPGRPAPAAAAGGNGLIGDALERHLDDLLPALTHLRAHLPRLARWGDALADALVAGGRLLAVGNGGSAAHAQHLTSELVGRYRDDRRPFSAISLHAEPSALTAIVNDYGPAEGFARQVRAHGRPGDVLVVLSTSGRSPNVVAAVDAARAGGLRVWALTGRGPNPVADRAHDRLCVDAAGTATVQEIHQVAVHLLCEAFDAEVVRRDGGARPPGHRHQAVDRCTLETIA